MKIKVIASTKVGYVLPKEAAVDFSGKSAGICYLPDTVGALFSASSEKTLKRATGNIRSGRHSVFGHPTYSLCLEEIPKILAMILNNEKMFFSQGMLVQVNERGTIENFVLKCTERLCGSAQLEIMEQTQKTMAKYLDATKMQPELYNYLLPYSKGARCTFPGWKCNSPCIFGGKNAMHRII